MEIKVSNRIVIIDPTDDLLEYSQNSLVLRNPEYDNAMRMGFYARDKEEYLNLYMQNGNKLILPFGCLKDVFFYAQRHGVKVENEIPPMIANNLQVKDIKLYDYQQQASNTLLKARNGVLEAPCGSGKTQIGIELINRLQAKTLWLTHTRELLQQSMARLKYYFPEAKVGTITEGKVNIGEDVTFATVQTLSKVAPDFYKDEFSVVIVDECHRCNGTPTKLKMFYKVLDNLNCRYKYGLTATPKRSDKLERSMFAIIGNLEHKITSKEIEKQGTIIRATHSPIYIDKEYDRMAYCKADGTADYSRLIEMLSFDKERNEIIIDNIVKNNRMGKKQLVLCDRVAHLEMLAMKVHEALPQVSVATISAKTSAKKRNFHSNDIIFATFTLAKEGLDIPDLDVLHITMPVKNRTTVVQSVGRVERNIKDKATPIVYDYVDNEITYCINAFKLRARYIKNK